MQKFTTEEQLRLLQTFEDEHRKKKDYFVDFMDRVSETVAPMYRSVVAHDMYFNLIKDRLTSGFYRCSEQLFSDMDLISHNSLAFNGDDSDITNTAQRLVEILRQKFK